MFRLFMTKLFWECGVMQRVGTAVPIHPFLVSDATSCKFYSEYRRGRHVKSKACEKSQVLQLNPLK